MRQAARLISRLDAGAALTVEWAADVLEAELDRCFPGPRRLRA